MSPSSNIWFFKLETLSISFNVEVEYRGYTLVFLKITTHVGICIKWLGQSDQKVNTQTPTLFAPSSRVYAKLLL